ncbi:MAG: hypothetical protein RL264_303 [Bacteroidota bacterium]|jgi:gliding motility-associated protein GldE
MLIESSSCIDDVPILCAGIGGSTLISFSVIIILLLVLSALMSGAESAFFSLTPQESQKIKEQGTVKSKLILSLLTQPKELLATLLIANNFVNVGIVIISSFMLSEAFGDSLLKAILEIIGITLMILLFGEVIPKVFASRNAYTVVNLTVYPIYYLSKTPPISTLRWLLVKGTLFIQHFKRSPAVNTDELEQALALTMSDQMEGEDHSILEGIVKFSKTEASQIMTPRIEVESLDVDADFKEVIQFVLDAGYSRIPVYKERTDNVVGLLFIKDLLPYINEENFDWKSVLRKPYFVPENKKINDLLQEFRNMKMHIAILVDEYGGATGIVTLEDILEEIVGDITDEFDDQEVVYTMVDERTFLFEGRTSLNDFYKITDIDTTSFEAKKGDSETLGGFVTEQAGRILKNNEYIEIGSTRLIVESSDKRRVKTVKVRLSQ